ncbi:MAG: type II secretion system protein M [Dokdonella sp.]
MAAWWQKLAPNERRMLGIGSVVVALLLGWALLWHPLAMKRVELQQTIEGQRRDLAYVNVGAAEIDRLHAAGTRSRADRQGRSLLALADATARSAGLENALKRVEPVGARSVRVSFESANFDALVDWIEDLSRSYGVEASDLSADRADGIGLVNARVTLQDAP